MSTPADAACPQTFSEPTNWLGAVITHLKNILFAPIEFGMGIVEGVADTLSLVGHGIQVVESAIINAVGSILENIVAKAEPTLDALLDWLDENPAIDTIVDVFAEVATLVLGIFGFEVPSFSGFGCYGM